MNFSRSGLYLSGNGKISPFFGKKEKRQEKQNKDRQVF